MILAFTFKDGQQVDVDTEEFGQDGIGAILDHLADIHGGVMAVSIKDPK